MNAIRARGKLISAIGRKIYCIKRAKYDAMPNPTMSGSRSPIGASARAAIPMIIKVNDHLLILLVEVAAYA